MDEQHGAHDEGEEVFEEQEEEEPGPEPEEEMHWQDGFVPPWTPQDAPSSQADSDMPPPQEEAPPPPPSAVLQRWLAEVRVHLVNATRSHAPSIRWPSRRREALSPLSPTLMRAS